MSQRTVQLVLHYDGTAFSGWQRQPSERTVQAVLESSLERLCDSPVKAVAAGRTDAGVHARGQSVGVRLPGRWTADSIRRSLNGILPADVWVAAAAEMRPDFHPRYSATARRYSYHVGIDASAHSPFRRRHEYVPRHAIDADLLRAAASLLHGDHCFVAFAVKGTAPATDSHRCQIFTAVWRAGPGCLVFEVEANRFLHHMVRFLVGTMLDVAAGRRPMQDILELLHAEDNRRTSPPAPPHALFLDAVRYPPQFYLPAG
jgi:tRNA pseudouridine38-40 synthase